MAAAGATFRAECRAKRHRTRPRDERRETGGGVMSIGGAGTFDGVFLSGVLAVVPAATL
jgi:hypothetical protein